MFKLRNILFRKNNFILYRDLFFRLQNKLAYLIKNFIDNKLFIIKGM